jgi:hypothetical protein
MKRRIFDLFERCTVERTAPARFPSLRAEVVGGSEHA